MNSYSQPEIVSVIEIWSFEFIWNLVLGIWNFTQLVLGI